MDTLTLIALIFLIIQIHPIIKLKIILTITIGSTYNGVQIDPIIKHDILLINSIGSTHNGFQGIFLVKCMVSHFNILI